MSNRCRNNRLRHNKQYGQNSKIAKNIGGRISPEQPPTASHYTVCLSIVSSPELAMELMSKLKSSISHQLHPLLDSMDTTPPPQAEEREAKLHLLCPVCVVECYVKHNCHQRHKQLFICFGVGMAGKALSRSAFTFVCVSVSLRPLSRQDVTFSLWSEHTQHAVCRRHCSVECVSRTCARLASSYGSCSWTCWIPAQGLCSRHKLGSESH